MGVANLENMGKLAFGPVPSRRLGKSLGINNIPAKTCSYSCVYCQVGKTINLTTERQYFYEPEDIFKEVKRKVVESTSRDERIDYACMHGCFTCSGSSVQVNVTHKITQGMGTF